MVETATAYERIVRIGVALATNVDLFALLLAREPRDVAACESDARRLAERHQGRRLLEISTTDLQANTGFTAFEAMQRLAAIELGRRGAVHGVGERVPIHGDPDVYALFRHLADEKQEHFCAAYLDSKNVPLLTKVVHIGTVNMSVVGPREVFRDAVRESAAAIVVAHNHPSGDPSPSPEDVAVTRRLAEVGRMLDIPLLDHVIVGRDTHYSMKKAGVL